MGLLDAPAVPPTKAGRERLLNSNAVALQGWRAALADRELNPATVVCLGDSIVEGQGATTLDRRFISQLRKRLRTRFPVTGVTGGRGFIGVKATGTSSFTWPVTLAGSPSTADVNYGPKRQSVSLASAGQSATFPLQGTSCDLVYARSTNTGTISYTVDGGSATTLNTATGAPNGTQLTGGAMARINLGSSGAHTLVVSYSSGGASTIEGVVEYDGDENAGIRVHDAGHHGYTTTQWANRNGFFYWMLSIKNLNPGLIIMEVGTNDLTNAISASTTLANWQSLLGYLRGVGCDPSILLVPMFKRSEAPAQPLFDPYVAAAYQLAASDAKVAICDLSTRMPAVGLPSGGSFSLYADTVHPTDKGHSMMADQILGAITP